MPGPDTRPRCGDGGCPDAGDADAATDAAGEDARIPDAARPDAARLDAARADRGATDLGVNDGGVTDGGDGGDGDIGDIGDTDALGSDGGSPDAGDAAPTDAGSMDAAAGGDGMIDPGSRDALAADGAATDAALGPDAGTVDGAASDAVPMDGARPAPDAPLAGLYAVTHTVTLSGDRSFVPGAAENTIVTLTGRGPGTYRMEVFDPDGTPLFAVDDLDFAAPEAGRYQFEYALVHPDPPAGCSRMDRHFQRGTFEGVEPSVHLAADEDLQVQFEGEGCRAEPFLVRFAVRWVPIPR